MSIVSVHPCTLKPDLLVSFYRIKLLELITEKAEHYSSNDCKFKIVNVH